MKFIFFILLNIVNEHAFADVSLTSNRTSGQGPSLQHLTELCNSLQLRLIKEQQAITSAHQNVRAHHENIVIFLFSANCFLLNCIELNCSSVQLVVKTTLCWSLSRLIRDKLLVIHGLKTAARPTKKLSALNDLVPFVLPSESSVTTPKEIVSSDVEEVSFSSPPPFELISLDKYVWDKYVYVVASLKCDGRILSPSLALSIAGTHIASRCARIPADISLPNLFNIPSWNEPHSFAPPSNPLDTTEIVELTLCAYTALSAFESFVSPSNPVCIEVLLIGLTVQTMPLKPDEFKNAGGIAPILSLAHGSLGQVFSIGRCKLGVHDFVRASTPPPWGRIPVHRTCAVIYDSGESVLRGIERVQVDFQLARSERTELGMNEVILRSTNSNHYTTCYFAVTFAHTAVAIVSSSITTQNLVFQTFTTNIALNQPSVVPHVCSKLVFDELAKMVEMLHSSTVAHLDHIDRVTIKNKGTPGADTSEAEGLEVSKLLLQYARLISSIDCVQ
jgi:hypothetical protein